jgi:type III secretion system YscQ/HrcQ family protein
MDDSPLTGTAETTRLVQNASVSLEAVVGRVQLSVDRLARLKPGEVLVCDGPVGQPVDLVANGTTVASGELVDIEGRLGVRILSRTR